MSKLVLFQGDSITDWGRSREVDSLLGLGYATMVQGELGYAYPNEYTFLNRGISGDRIVDIYARMKRDILNLKPDYMSLLIGVNDVWHDMNGGRNGVEAEKFEKIYSMLIEEILETLPDIQMMLLEPFILETGATADTEEEPNRWDTFYTEVRERAEAVKRIAAKYNLVFVPLQAKFDELSEQADKAYWASDGVHPTAAGHCVIKNEWMKAFEENFR